MKNYPAKPNDFAKGAPEVKIPLQMDPKYRDIGAKTKVVRRRASLVSTGKDKQTYGFRAFMTKEDVQPESPKNPLKVLQSLLEADDLTELPQDVIDDLKSLMRRGVNPSKKEIEAYQQQTGSTEMPRWKNALELLDTAYLNANIKKPDVGTDGWKQYLDLLPYAVKLLSDKYGLQGPNASWRVSTPIVVEGEERNSFLQSLLAKEKKDEPQQEQPEQDGANTLEPPKDYKPSHVGKKRFFVSIPGAGQTEIDVRNIEDVIDSLTNKMRRHGVKVRIDQKTDEGAILSFWFQDVKRERITIRQVG